MTSTNRRPSAMVPEPDPIDRHVGRRLRSLRLSRGIDAAAIDLAIGATAGTIERFESGQRPIGASHLARIAIALDVPPALFFQDSNVISPPGAAGPPRLPIDPKQFWEAHRFIAAYGRLPDPQLRRAVLDLVKALAGAAPTEQDWAEGERESSHMDDGCCCG